MLGGEKYKCVGSVCVCDDGGEEGKKSVFMRVSGEKQDALSGALLRGFM